MNGKPNEEPVESVVKPADATRDLLEKEFSQDGTEGLKPSGGTKEQGSHSPDPAKPDEAKPEDEKPKAPDASDTGDGKPKGEPVEKKPDGTPKVEDVDFEKLPENGENFKRMRESLKKQKAEIEALKAARKTPEVPKTPEVRSEPAPQRISPEQALNALHGVVEGTEKRFSEKAVREYIRKNYTRAELNAEKVRAMEGGFGEKSSEIAAFIDEAMPYVEVNEQETIRSRQAQEQFTTSRRDAVNDVLGRFPELNDPESADYKEFDAATHELEKSIPWFTSIPHGMKIVEEFVTLKREAASVKVLREEAAAHKAEVERLNKLLGKSTTAPHVTTSAEKGGVQTTKQALEEAFKQ